MVQVRQASFADGHQLAFRVHSLHKPARRPDVKRGDAKIAAVANLSGCEGVHHFRRELRQKLGGRDHRLLETAGLG